MLLDVVFYLMTFSLSIFMIAVFQRTSVGVEICTASGKSKLLSNAAYCMTGLIFLFAVIAMYGLRYGIGTDYLRYEEIYGFVHGASLGRYWDLHTNGERDFYIEPGYYLLNRVSLNYRLLLWGAGILIFALFLMAVKDYSQRISYAFALFIYLTTQYIYSLNSVRFSIALCFVLLGYVELIEGRAKRFVILVLLASAFHTTMLLCMAMLFLKQYKNKKVNAAREIVFYAAILVFPWVSRYLLEMLSRTSLFGSYFEGTLYQPSEEMVGSMKWVLHIIPVALPLLVFCRKEIFGSEDTGTLFRICMTEIPCRMLGLYNQNYLRFARCAQIAQVLLIPMALARIPQKQKRTALYAYYIAWYVFYFAYYAIVGDKGDSLPYVWVFS